MKAAKTETEFKKVMKSATTAQLVTFYNERTGKTIKKFSSREAGERQCLAAFLGSRQEERRADDRRADDRREGGSPRSLFDEAPGDEVTPEPALRPSNNPLIRAVSQVSAIKPKTEHKVIKCPSCGAIEDQTAAGKEGTAAGDRVFCHKCQAEYYPQDGRIYKEPVKSASRAAAIETSWLDPEIKEKRSERHAVEVDGTQYKSVRQAFKDLGLPLAKHIAFRMALKAKGKAEFAGKKFKLLEAS